MSYSHSMATHTGLVPLDAQHASRDSPVRRNRSLKYLISKSSASKHRNDPSAIVSSEFPPSVIASHAITSDGHPEHPATSDPYADTVMRIRTFSAGNADHYVTVNGNPGRPTSPIGVAIDEGHVASPGSLHSHTRTASSDRIFPNFSHSRVTSIDGVIPHNPHRRTPSEPRPAQDDDVARGVVRELHEHAKKVSTSSATKNEDTKKEASKHSHSRTLSESSAALGGPGPAASDGQGLSPHTSALTPQSQRMRNFSRPSSEHKRNLSADEPRRSMDRPPSRTARYSTRPPVSGPPPVSLRKKQSYDTVVHRKLSQTYDTIPEGSTGLLPPRPSTSCSETKLKPTASCEPLRGSLKSQRSRTQLGDGSTEVEQVTWKSPKTENEVRDSMRSGWSAWSSGSTKHSSVFTKMSSVRDSTTTAEMSDNEANKGLHVNGDRTHLHPRLIEEEPRDPHRIRMSFLKGTDIDLRSSKMVLPGDETSGSDGPLSWRVQEQLIKQEAEVPDEFVPSEFPSPPQLLKPTASTDQYGFRKATRDVTESQYNAWHKDYLKNQNRRTSRWVSLMKSAGLASTDPTSFPTRSEKVQRYVRKGVPPKWRGALWFYYAGGQPYVDKFPGLYSKLVAQSVEPQLQNSDKEAIDRDINRTFPDNIHFKPDLPLPEGHEAPMLASLRRLLYAFAIHHPKIGYCQSLNFIAGMLLLFLDEEKAFWMLHIITNRYLPGTHEVSLEGANVDLWVLMLALREEQPRVWAMIGGETAGEPTRLPPVSLCTTPWFMSLFIGTLPVESVLRMWDMLFYDGSTTIFRAALAIFRLGEAEILHVQDPMEIFQVVQTVPRRMIDAGALAMATNRKGSVSTVWIEQRRKEKKEFYAQERALEKIRKQSGDGGLPKILAPGADHPVMRMPTAAKSMGDLRRQRSKGVLVKRPPSRRK